MCETADLAFAPSPPETADPTEAKAPMREGEPDRHAVVQATMQHVDVVWDAALRTGVLDPDKPIALLMVALLHFVPPEKGPHGRCPIRRASGDDADDIALARIGCLCANCSCCGTRPELDSFNQDAESSMDSRPGTMCQGDSSLASSQDGWDGKVLDGLTSVIAASGQSGQHQMCGAVVTLLSRALPQLEPGNQRIAFDRLERVLPTALSHVFTFEMELAFDAMQHAMYETELPEGAKRIRQIKEQMRQTSA